MEIILTEDNIQDLIDGAKVELNTPGGQLITLQHADYVGIDVREQANG